MPLTIIHGDNQILSRKYLQELHQSAKLKNQEIITLNGRQSVITDIVEALETQSLFGGDRLVIIEDLHKNLSKNTVKEIISYVTSHVEPNTTNLVLWSPSLLTATQLKPFTHWTIKTFKSSPVIFTFLDSLEPKHQHLFLPLFNEACLKDSPEFVFFMLIKHLRQLILVADSRYKDAPWKISKLKNQRQKFGESNLMDLHDVFIDLDFRLKTGRTVSDLKSELSFLLAKL